MSGLYIAYVSHMMKGNYGISKHKWRPNKGILCHFDAIFTNIFDYDSFMYHGKAIYVVMLRALTASNGHWNKMVKG